MRTLVYILPDKDGGVASVVRNLLEFKTDRFFTKVILLHNKNDSDRFRIVSPLNADEVVRIAYNDKWTTKHCILNRIKKELDSNSILISNDGGIDLDVINFYGLKIPVVYIMHGDLKHYYNVVSAKSYMISKIITVSYFLKQQLEDKFVSTAIESIKFPVPNITYLKRTNSKLIRLVFVGSLIKGKGVYDLVKIVNRLEANNVDYILNIIGQGVEEVALKSAFKSNQNVRFLGQLDNSKVIAMHASHDIILLPSVSEGMPVVIIEAMKCGVIPMVTDLRSGIPELVEHDKNGYLIPLAETDNYSKYICALKGDVVKRRKMSDLCIEKANAAFDAIAQTSAYETAFGTASITSVEMPFTKKIPYYIPLKLLRILRK